MTSVAKTIASFSRAEGILAVLFGLGFVLGFLLTPLGVETRIHELRTPVFAAFFITIGLLLPLAGLVSLFLRKEKVPGSNPGVGSTSSPRLDFVAGGQALTPRSSSLDAEAAAFRVIYGDRST